MENELTPGADVYSDDDQRKNYETAMRQLQKYAGDSSYDRVAITASAMASKGKYLEAVQWISDYISHKENNSLGEFSGVNLAENIILRKLAAETNPVITKADVLNAFKK